MNRAAYKIPDYPADRPKVPEVVALVKAYYAKPGNGVGGNLHCVLDDGNLDGISISWARQRALDAGDADGVALADKLLKMTPQRRRVYKIRKDEEESRDG